jgi:hypothetical protein
LHITQIYTALSEDEFRNQQIVTDAVEALNEDRTPIVLVQRKEHVARLEERFASGTARNPDSQPLYAQTTGRNRAQKFVIIDNRLVWYGSVNLLSFGSSEETMMRLDSRELSAELELQG